MSPSLELHSPRSADQTAGILTAITLLRTALLIWAALVVGIDLRGDTLIKGGPAIAILTALAVWTAVCARFIRTPSTRSLTGIGTAIDVALAAVVAGVDDYIYDGPHPQTFASAWPLCAAVAAGSLHGATVGAGAGLLLGISDAVGIAVFAENGLSGQWTSVIGTTVLLTVAGLFAGRITSALQRAEMVAARASVREDVARRLHDGVLQTLAAVQRRSDDAALVTLAREQELDLRRYIDDDRVTADASVGTLAERHDPTRLARRDRPVLAPADAVRDTVHAAERRTGTRCEFVVIDAPASTPAERVEALCGAVAEAIANAHKHADAALVVVCVDVDERGGTLCTVNDDGIGFDASNSVEGVGITRSIRARLDEVGGTAGLASRPGHGTEVTLWIP